MLTIPNPSPNLRFVPSELVNAFIPAKSYVLYFKNSVIGMTLLLASSPSEHCHTCFLIKKCQCNIQRS